MRSPFGLLLVVTTLCVATTGDASAQQQGDSDHEWCDDSWRNREDDRFCEVREFTLPARSLISLDGGPNGGITVEGWDRNEILVLAKVEAWSRRSDDPEDIVRDIEVITDGRVIHSEGPNWRSGGGRSRSGWSVSYEVRVPSESDLSLEAVNGGIEIVDVTGSLEFQTTNGGVSLIAVGGDVRGYTTNGGVQIELEGDQWEGRALDVRTTNGGVTLDIPSDYRADLETGTTNGGMRIDFPIVVQGRINPRRIHTELNGGGPLVRVVTTNGGVTIRRR